MSAITDIVNRTLKHWNEECSKMEKKLQFEIKCGIRTKKYYTNRIEFYEEKVAEFKLFQIEDKVILLYRTELKIPDKMKGIKMTDVHNDLVDTLYRDFLYESIGSFCAMTRQNILSQDYCEYDIEKDRLKQHSSSVDMVIKTLNDGDWYKKDKEFDVFMDEDTSDKYYVYTEHAKGQSNNGIASIKREDALVIQAPKKQIILLD